jgi:HAMP domain-containing protein
MPAPIGSSPARSLTVGSSGTAATAGLRIRPRLRRSGNLLLNLSIGKRLTVGFLLAALIATLAAGLVGLLRAQSLSRQSAFYQQLLQINTSLNIGANYLQLMNTEIHTLLSSAEATAPSQETINQERQAVQGLATRYDSILSSYLATDLLTNHPDEAALLAEAGQSGQVEQQETLAASALRTWQLYRASLQQILQDLASGNLNDAQHQLRFQAEPTNADALSALRALIQLDQQLAAAVQQAATVEEEQQLITSIIAAVLAALAIVLVGWFISGTLVRRLRHLQSVTRAIERGQLDARVVVIGRDEIAEVSAAFNAMLETLLTLLEETRRQRDALTNAARHLFSDMRVVSAGDLRVSAPVSDDPIGMLANAFNFTVGRFRRFVLRVQSALQQQEVIGRRQLEQAEALLLALPPPQASPAPEALPSLGRTPQVSDGGLQRRSPSRPLNEAQEEIEREIGELLGRLRRCRERLQPLVSEDLTQRFARLGTLLREVESTGASAPAGPDLWRAGGPQGVRREGRDGLSLRGIGAEIGAIRQHISRTAVGLDRELTALGLELQRLRQRVNGLPALGGAGAGRETAEVNRLAVAFASESMVLAQQLMALTQEMQSMLIGFQFEAVEGSNVESPATPPGPWQSPGSRSYALVSEIGPRPLRT